MKILISDMFGTMIPNGMRMIEYYYCQGEYKGPALQYGSERYYKDKEYYQYLLDKTFEKLKQQLKPFFDENNKLKIVTSIEGHNTSYILFTQYFNRFYEWFREYENLWEIYLEGKQKTIFELTNTKKIATDIKQDDEKTIVEWDNGKNVILLNKKTEVYHFLDSSYSLQKNQLYAVGDTYNDINMILECIKRRGKGSFISDNIYSDDKNVSDIIHDEVIWNLKCKSLDEARRLCPNYD